MNLQQLLSFRYRIGYCYYIKHAITHSHRQNPQTKKDIPDKFSITRKLIRDVLKPEFFTAYLQNALLPL